MSRESLRMMIQRLALALLGVALMVWVLPVRAADESKSAPAAQATKMIEPGPYPLSTCVVSGDKLGGKMGPPVLYRYKGREVRFCCNACIPEFKKDPTKYLKKIDDAVIEQQKPDYPLDTCVVSGKKLDSGGMTPVDYVYKNRLVRFCCGGCSKSFRQDPAKYLKKIDDAVIEQQKPGYPLDTCVVSGQKLGSGGMTPVDYVYKNRLVRFCCGGCIKTFKQNPAKYLALIGAARAKTDKAPPAGSEMKTTDTTNGKM